MSLHILALETSSSVCGVALLSRSNTGVTVHALEHDATAEHAERLLPMVDQMLAQEGVSRAQLSAVAFGQGPGGFTGLRVACGVSQGMAFALGIQVVPVPSLLAVAARASHSAPYDPAALRVVVQDARMGEVYLAAFEPGSGDASDWSTYQEPILLNAADVGPWLLQTVRASGRSASASTQVILMGDALDAYSDLRELAQGRPWLTMGLPLRPDVRTVAHLALHQWDTGAAIPPELAAPLYVRDKVAFTTLERQHGAGGNPRAPDLPVSLVPMSEADVDDVAAIEQSVQAFPWTRGNFADALEAGYGAWVARQGGRTAGFCITMFAPDVAHVLVIAVVPESQKKGIGALMLAHAEREAVSRGLESIVLEVRPSNENALNFYRRQGYRLLAMRKDYYPAADGKREDACVMQKKLPEVEGGSD